MKQIQSFLKTFFVRSCNFQLDSCFVWLLLSAICLNRSMGQARSISTNAMSPWYISGCYRSCAMLKEQIYWWKGSMFCNVMCGAVIIWSVLSQILKTYTPYVALQGCLLWVQTLIHGLLQQWSNLLPIPSSQFGKVYLHKTNFNYIIVELK